MIGSGVIDLSAAKVPGYDTRPPRRGASARRALALNPPSKAFNIAAPSFDCG